MRAEKALNKDGGFNIRLIPSDMSDEELLRKFFDKKLVIDLCINEQRSKMVVVLSEE